MNKRKLTNSEIIKKYKCTGSKEPTGQASTAFKIICLEVLSLDFLSKIYLKYLRVLFVPIVFSTMLPWNFEYLLIFVYPLQSRNFSRFDFCFQPRTHTLPRVWVHSSSSKAEINKYFFTLIPQFYFLKWL